MKNKYILPALSAVCILAVIGMIFALTLGGKNAEKSKYTPPAFDTAAENGTPNGPEDRGYSELDAKAFQVSVCGKLISQSGKVDLYLTNPESNAVWLKARILDEDGNMLGETGLIKPGEYVKSLKLDTVPKQTETVKLKIMAYEPGTYYSAGVVSLNTTLEIG